MEEKNVVEMHPWGVYMPDGAKVLMLGSFPPPQRRWSMDFYYPNIQNDMWRILGLIFHNDKEFFLADKKHFDIEKCKAFCSERGVAMGDTAHSVVRLRGNASDKFLQVVAPLDIVKVLDDNPSCRAVVITGQKAMDTLLGALQVDVTEPLLGTGTDFMLKGQSYRLYRMPSSSRAYPKSPEEKSLFYRKMFEEIGVL